MEKENIISINRDLLKRHDDYITRKNRKTVLIKTIYTLMIALYTSLWWIGIVLKNENVLVVTIGITIVVVLITIIVMLLDEPTDPFRDANNNGKGCCSKETGGIHRFHAESADLLGGVTGCGCESKDSEK